MMWVALAIVAASAIFAVAGLRMFREWVAAQQRDVDDDDAAEDPQEDPAAEDERDQAQFDAVQFRRMLRDGPRGIDERHRQEWRADHRRRGLRDEDIQALLDTREPIVRL